MGQYIKLVSAPHWCGAAGYSLFYYLLADNGSTLLAVMATLRTATEVEVFGAF